MTPGAALRHIGIRRGQPDPASRNRHAGRPVESPVAQALEDHSSARVCVLLPSTTGLVPADVRSGHPEPSACGENATSSRRRFSARPVPYPNQPRQPACRLMGAGKSRLKPGCASIAFTDSEEGQMATLTIRGLDEAMRERLRVRAAQHGRSMEAEVRAILAEALPAPRPLVGLGSRIHARFAALGGVDLEIPERTDKPRSPALR